MKKIRKLYTFLISIFVILSLCSCHNDTHVITWQNEDGTILAVDEVANGQIPVFQGLTPTKDSSSQYEYSFAGWREEIVPAYSDGVYTASFIENIRKYEISWFNDNGSLIKTDYVQYGLLPSYSGVTPSKKSSNSTNYAFAGWTPQIETVTENASYTAVFSTTVRQYEITWKNEDGSILNKSYADYGSKPVYQGEVPFKSSDEYNNYYFSSWYPKINDSTIVDRDMTFTARFSSTRKTANIKWVNYDGTLLKEDIDVAYGSLPTYNGIIPEKNTENGYSYEFSGWEPAISTVMGDVTYKAQFKKEVAKYEIKWVNYDGSILAVDYVSYGKTPNYHGSIPYRPSDGEHHYSFEGWDSAISPVDGNKTYKAKFSSTDRKYIITWIDYNGTVLEVDENVIYGEMPSYDGEEPSRLADSQYEYTFSGWNPSLSSVTQNVTYRATYSKKETGKKFTVTWLNYDGTILKVDKVLFYQTPVYDGEEPKKDRDEMNSYLFCGWDKEIKPVTCDVVYTAKFEKTARKYLIKWLDYDGSILSTKEVEYGSNPQYSGKIPTRHDSENYRYTFTNWSPNLSPIYEDQTYTAIYREDRLYTISFYNYNDVLLFKQKYIKGEMPSYDGTPTKPSTNAYSYEFSGWSPSISLVTGNQSYTATFKEIKRKYTITWKNYDGTTLATDSYSYNAMPSYSGSAPIRPSDTQYRYSFTGWSPHIERVTGNKTYTAQFEKILFKSYVSFDLQGGTTNSSTKARYSDLLDGKDLFYDLKKTGYSFMGWSYNGIKLFDENGTKLVENITLSERMTLKAVFGKAHTFSIVNQSTVGGKLTGAGQYATGQTVTAKAIPDQGYQFAGWMQNGTLVSTAENYSFTMPNQDYVLTGSFSLKPYKLTLSRNGSYGDIKLKVNGQQKVGFTAGSHEEYVKYTSTVEITAVSKSDDLVFMGWYDEDGRLVSSMPIYQFTMPYNDYKLIAKWKNK